MNQPIRAFINPSTNKKEHTVNLHYGLNVFDKYPNRKQRREMFQKRNRNPWFGIPKHTGQEIRFFDKKTGELIIRVINDNLL